MIEIYESCASLLRTSSLAEWLTGAGGGGSSKSIESLRLIESNAKWHKVCTKRGAETLVEDAGRGCPGVRAAGCSAAIDHPRKVNRTPLRRQPTQGFPCWRSTGPPCCSAATSSRSLPCRYSSAGGAIKRISAKNEEINLENLEDRRLPVAQPAASLPALLTFRGTDSFTRSQVTTWPGHWRQGASTLRAPRS